MEVVGERLAGGYLARPVASGRRAGVLVGMEMFGVTAYIRDVAERIAAAPAASSSSAS